MCHENRLTSLSSRRVAALLLENLWHPGWTDSQVNANLQNQNLRRDLCWVAKWWKTCVDLRTNLNSTKVNGSRRKSVQDHKVNGQRKRKLKASFQLALTCESVWPGLKVGRLARLWVQHLLVVYITIWAVNTGKHASGVDECCKIERRSPPWNFLSNVSKFYKNKYTNKLKAALIIIIIIIIMFLMVT